MGGATPAPVQVGGAAPAHVQVGGAAPARTQPLQCHNSNEFEHRHRPRDQALLEAKLTPKNYKEKFHQLLCREEEEHERILQERYSVWLITMVTAILLFITWYLASSNEQVDTLLRV